MTAESTSGPAAGLSEANRPGGAPDDGSQPSLQGNLGVASVFFSVLAWAAPLLVVVGLMPSMIGFAGSGIIASFAATTRILLLFSIGYTTITRYVDRPGAFYRNAGQCSGLHFRLGVKARAGVPARARACLHPQVTVGVAAARCTA
ncbi:hypothetical protein [Sphaerisporangium sp. NPDC051011]|uniref:hypothetical protein n=1 Tax=Sphaerisporangium sp. NPDC051011 TaxID=3155792 RepID=UPI0033F48954